MTERLIQGIVRILDSKGAIAGTGFLISESGLIATCSHVIQHEFLQQRGDPRPKKVTIVFHVTDDEQDAWVEPDWWLPWNAGDLAIIQVKGILPQGIQPLPLGSAEGTGGHEVCTFGFPNISDIAGLGADGRVVRILLNAGRSMLQLRSSEITAGFSGAPIWDKLGRRVIGMVSAITEPDYHHRLVETAFAISTETLRNVCPSLQLSDVCPYRGLSTFTEADAEFFFGRHQVVESLLNKLRQDPRFLIVLGPSGSGKSSVVQAKLIPQLRNEKVPGSNRWGIIVTHPATNPFDELTKQGMVGTSYDLIEKAHVWLSQHPKQERLMLVIDQFEQLLSICPEVLRRDFIVQLVNLLQSSLPITVLLVMRDDFYSRLTQQEELIDWVERSNGPIHMSHQLRQDELIEIVRKPIDAVGLKAEEGLVELVIKDTLENTEEKGQVVRSTILPLLEFALTELWERRQGGMLKHEAYRSIGGVAGALPNWADQVFYTFQPNERLLVRQILTDLVYIGDKKQGILDSRRRRTLISLCRNAEERERVEHIVLHMVEKRLLVTDRDLQSNQETVEIIHDILLRQWRPLQEWLDKDYRFLTWHQELERLVYIWMGTGHDTNKLLRGHDLTEAQQWLKDRKADLNRDELVFLHDSTAHRIRFVTNIIVIILLLISISGAASWFYLHQVPDSTRVTSLQDDEVGSLRWAINTAPSGSTITFDKDLWGHTIVLNADLVIGKKNLYIHGPGANLLTISSRTHQINVTSGSSINIFDLTFKGGKSNLTSLLRNAGVLTLTKSNVLGNTAPKPKESTSYFASSGGIDNVGTLTLTNSTVSDNSAFGLQSSLHFFTGGGIANTGTLTLINSIITNNKVFDGNGGGIYNTGMLTLTNSTVSNNSAVDANINGGGGGGIQNNGRCILTNSTISHNSISTIDADGGGINNGGTLTLTNSSVTGNTALGQVSDNSINTYSYGGGIANGGNATLINSTIANNSISARTKGSGGGIYNSTFYAIDPPNAGILTLINSTVANNSISAPNSSGGGIMFEGSRATITFSTIYGNRAFEDGGGVAIEDGQDNQSIVPSQISIQDSLVAGNYAHINPDISGVLTSNGYNLIQNVSGTTFTLNNQHNTDFSGDSFPNLGIDSLLRDNGGLTKAHTFTYALLPTSPVIDAIPISDCHVTVNGSLIITDQRGIKRPQGKGCDIGAFESISN